MTTPSETSLQEATLPSLGATVSRIISLYTDTDYTMDSVIGILESDPAVSARILRLANSAYFGFRSRVDTLQRAVVLLGSVTVQAVALAASILDAWGRQGPPEEVEAVWVQSYLRATAARHLGLRLPDHPHRSEADALFMENLLAQIGKLYFLQQEPEKYAAALQEHRSQEALCRQETEVFGWDHAEAGATLLESWRLPTRLTAVIRYQYRNRLRRELRPDWEVLNAAAAVCDRETQAPSEIPEPLLADLHALVERKRPEAQAFYTAIS